MATAELWALLSTCDRLQVGAVVTLDTRIISTGFNGSVSGADHCDHSCDCSASRGHTATCRLRQPCTEAMHAEANALAFAGQYGVPTKGTHLYVTHSPCLACARTLIQHGVTEVTYKTAYRSPDGLALLEKMGVLVHHPAPLSSGLI